MSDKAALHTELRRYRVRERRQVLRDGELHRAGDDALVPVEVGERWARLGFVELIERDVHRRREAVQAA